MRSGTDNCSFLFHNVPVEVLRGEEGEDCGGGGCASLEKNEL